MSEILRSNHSFGEDDAQEQPTPMSPQASTEVDLRALLRHGADEEEED